jgi:hypothetical protein
MRAVAMGDAPLSLGQANGLSNFASFAPLRATAVDSDRKAGMVALIDNKDFGDVSIMLNPGEGGFPTLHEPSDVSPCPYDDPVRHPFCGLPRGDAQATSRATIPQALEAANRNVLSATRPHQQTLLQDQQLAQSAAPRRATSQELATVGRYIAGFGRSSYSS